MDIFVAGTYMTIAFKINDAVYFFWSDTCNNG